MQNIDENDSTQILSRARLTEIPERRVLIVEDDLSLTPLWEKAFQGINFAVQVDWATNLEKAEKLIRDRYAGHLPYNLVVADIFLEGRGSGIDLWNRYGEEALNFVFVSAFPVSKEDFLHSLRFGSPLYLKKPLTLQKCRDIVQMALSPIR